MTSDRQLHEILHQSGCISFHELKKRASYDSPRLLKNALQRLVLHGKASHKESDNSYKSITPPAVASLGNQAIKQKGVESKPRANNRKKSMTKSKANTKFSDQFFSWCKTRIVNLITPETMAKWKRQGQVNTNLVKYVTQLKKNGAVLSKHKNELDELFSKCFREDYTPTPSELGREFALSIGKGSDVDETRPIKPEKSVPHQNGIASEKKPVSAVFDAIDKLKYQLNKPVQTISPVENIDIKLEALVRLAALLGDPSISDCLVAVSVDLKRLQSHSEGSLQ